MDVVYQLQILRAELIQNIDAAFTRTIRAIQEERKNPSAGPREENRASEIAFPFTVGTGFFKGKRPAAVLIRGVRQNAPSWKKVFEVIMKDCMATPACRERLTAMQGRVYGRNRLLLSSDGSAMRSPVKIGEGLYAETHYDTETLLKILTYRLLKPAGYDYSAVSIVLRSDFGQREE